MASARTPGIVWTHNDSGDEARLFAVDGTGRTLATVQLRGVQPRDWEDLARGPEGELWIGDIGDNRARRDRGILVLRIEEPAAPADTEVTAARNRLNYPDEPHDAEALLADRAGRAVVVAKDGAGVYRSPRPLRDAATQELERVGDLDLSLVTGGATSPDGSRAALRTYFRAVEYDVDGDALAEALIGAGREVPLPPEQQGEAISYTADGGSLLVTSEGRGAAVQQVHRTPAEQRPAARTTTTTLPPQGVQVPLRRIPWPAVGGVVIGVAALVLLLRRR